MTNIPDLIARLRGLYSVGKGYPPEFGRRPFPTVQIQVEAADALEAQARKIADCNRLRDDERLTWDAQHKRQASMNAHLAELVTDAHEELRKCQQDAIALQDRLAEAEAEIARYNAESRERQKRLAEAERDAARLKERLEEATDLLGFAEARLLAFGQHNSTNPDYVLAMDAMKLFLLTADSAAMEGWE